MNIASNKSEVRDYNSATTSTQAQAVINKAIKTRMKRQQKRHQAEIGALHQQVVRMAAENARLRDRLALAESKATRSEGELLAARAKTDRRDQTIAALRSALNDRKGQAHV